MNDRELSIEQLDAIVGGTKNTSNRRARRRKASRASSDPCAAVANLCDSSAASACNAAASDACGATTSSC